MNKCLWLSTITAIVLLPLASACADEATAAAPVKKPFLPNKIEIELPKAVIAADKPLDVSFSFTLPAKHHLNKEAPTRVVVTSPDTALNITSRMQSLSHTVTVPARPTGTAKLEFSALLYFCEDGDATLCKIRGLAITQPYEATPNGSTSLQVAAAVTD